MLRQFVMLSLFALTSTTVNAQDKPARVDQAGDPLPEGALARLGTVRFRQPDWVRSIAISPDGKNLASSGDWKIRLWEFPSGRPLKTYPGFVDKSAPNYERASTLAFNSKGELVGLGINGNGTVTYDVATGKVLKEFKEFPYLTAAGPVTVVEDGDRTVIKNLNTGGKVPLSAKVDLSLGFGLSSNGRFLAIGGTGSIRRFDAASGKELRAISATRFLKQSSSAISNDGKMLAGVVDRSDFELALSQQLTTDVVLWEEGAEKKSRTLKTYYRFVEPITLSDDGKFLAAGIGDATYSGGPTIVVLDTATGKEVERPVGHDTRIRSVAVASDATTVVSADEHGIVRTWDATSGKHLRGLQLPSRFMYPALQPGGTIVVWTDNRIHFHSLATNKEIQSIPFPSGQDFQFSADGKYFAASGEEYRLFELGSGKELSQFRAKQVLASAFAPDSKFIVRTSSVGLVDQRVEVHEIATGKKGNSFAVPYDVEILVVSPDGKLLASSQRDQTITLWDLSDGRRLWSMRHPARVRRPNTSLSFANPIAFSPNGKILASGGDDHTVRLWDVATGKELRKFIGHEGAIGTLAFSKDGKLLASGSDDTSVLVWEMPTN